MSSNPARGRGRGGRRGRGSSRGNNQGGRSNRRGNRIVVNKKKFEGREDDLKGHIFDCTTSARQNDNYTTTMKEISSYVGTNYKEGQALHQSLYQLQQQRYDKYLMYSFCQWIIYLHVLR